MASTPRYLESTIGPGSVESGEMAGGPVFVLQLVGLSVLSAGVRLWGIADRELWFDENCTFYIVHHLFDWPADGSDALREFAHLPYFFLLNFWTGIVGETIWGLRSFSALIGALGVFVLGLLGTRLGGRRVGLIAAVLAAINPLQIHYSQEARGYTTWLLAITLCIYCLHKAAERLNKRWWLVYVVVAWLTVLTHYFTLAWFLGTIGGVLIACDRRRFLRQWLVSHAVLAFMLLPVIWFLVLPLSEGGPKPWFREMWAAYPPILAIPKSIWAMLPSGGYPAYLGSTAVAAEAASLRWATVLWFPARWVPMIIVGGMVLFAVVRPPSQVRSDQSKANRTIVFLAILSVAFFLAAFIHSWLLQPTYIVGRYDLAAWPSLVLTVALLVERSAQTLSSSEGTRRVVRLFLTAVLVSCSGIVFAGVQLAPVRNASTDRARGIAGAVGPDDLVISLGQYKLFVLYEWHQLGFQAEVISFPPQHDRQLCWYDADAELADPARIAKGVSDVTQRIEEALAHGRRVWLLVPSEPSGARWEVDRNLFQRLGEMGVDIQPVDKALGLGRIVLVDPAHDKRR